MGDGDTFPGFFFLFGKFASFCSFKSLLANLGPSIHHTSGQRSPPLTLTPIGSSKRLSKGIIILL